jgi:outer membrane protein assembly factor BamB
MYSPAKGLPSSFDPGKFKKNSEEIDLATTKNVKWIAKLGSQTYGNPVVAGGKVLIGTNNAVPRDPRFKDDKSILMCFDEYTGNFIWQLVVAKLASGKVNDWEYLGLLSSPDVEGDKVWLTTSRCEIVCLDLNGQANGNQGPFQDEGQYMAGPGKPKVEVTPKDADILWRYDMMDELGVFPHNATNCSVITLGDRLYTCTSNGQDWTHVNIPSPLSPSFIALDKNTGEFLGEDDAKIGPNIKHGQWSSPSIGKVNGKEQVYFGGGDGVLYAFDPTPVKEGDSVYLKHVWSFDCVPEEYKKDKSGKPIKYPAAEGPSEINATPVFYKNRVYVAIGQDPEHGEGVGRLVCVDATKKGDVTKTALIWDFKKIHRSISTVSIDPTTGLLFIGDFSGFVFCLDAETGKEYWEHDMQAHIWGSTLVADGKVYIGDEDGDCTVLADAKEKKVLSEVNMGAPVYSTPIVANGTLYIGSQTHLYAIAEGAKPVEPGAKK